MRYMQTKRVFGFVVLLSLFSIALVAAPAAPARDDNRAPDLPCSDLQVPAGNKVSYHVYARGVQIYRWDGTTWAFIAPVATLFADANYNGQVGIHYRGPKWESNSGSIVAAGNALRCSPDLNAIPWLRLEATETTGPGIFSSVTYVHRTNTTGGLAPATPGDFIGQSIEVPYTAEYYFYRAEDWPCLRRRLVIENVSAIARCPDGQRMEINFHSHLDNNGDGVGDVADITCHRIALSDQGTFGGMHIFSANHKVLAFADGCSVAGPLPEPAGD